MATMISSIMFKMAAIFAYVLSRILELPIIGPMVDWFTAMLAVMVRPGAGAFVVSGALESNRPARPLRLYEYESCPYSKKVREVISALDLDCEIYPCPRETMKQYGVCRDSRFRPVVGELGGQQMFPFLVDDNTGRRMYESKDIVEYLYAEYGNRAARSWYLQLPEMLNMLLLTVPGFLRPLPRMGLMRIPSKKPDKPLQMFGFEGHPGAKRIRELLCSLELPYMLRTTAFNCSPSKFDRVKAFMTRKTETPPRILLADPNSGFYTSSVSNALSYLDETYRTGNAPKETMSDYSTAGASAEHGTITSKKKKGK